MDSEKNIWFSRFVAGTYKVIISYIFFLIILALLFLAAFSTSFIDSREKIYFLPDSAWANLLFFAAALALSLLFTRGRIADFARRLEEDEGLFLWLRRGILAFLWIMLSVWALSTRLVSGGDQITVLDAAYGLANGDFSALSPVNYLYDYNHQVGLAMVELLLNRVLGEYNFTAYHLINAALVPLIFRELSILGGMFGLSRGGQLLVLVLSVLFAPLSLYISFIYGTLPGLLFALLAIRLELRYFRGSSWVQALLSAICIAAAVLLKSNYLIFMVGMLIYAAVEIVRERKAKRLVLVLFVVIFYVAQAKIPLGIFARMRGADIPSGVSTWAWVTMGLQEGDNPGWYNGYTLDTLIGSEFNTHTQEIWVKEDLKARLEELWRDKDSARDFFVRKTASQWNEPSFESICILFGKGIDSESGWPGYIISSTGNHRLTLYLNYLNFAILAGALLYIALLRKTEHYFDSLILPMIFIGGFLFHLVWEAKGQYTLPYFVLLLPYAVMGYSEAAKRLAHAGATLKNGEAALSIDRKSLAVNLVLFTLAVLVLWYLFHGTLGSITGDSAKYMGYLATHS